MTKTTYAVQKNGQVTLPRELREEYSIKEGDKVQFIKTADGWTVVKAKAKVNDLLDQLKALLEEEGVTLTQLLEDGDKTKSDLVKELYDAES